MPDRCEIPRCRAEADVIYLGHGVCSSCWNRFTANDAPPDALRMVLGIEAEPEPKEMDMSKKKTEKSAELKPAKAAKEKKALREKIDRTGYRTIALRVSPQDFSRIHAGAKKAGETLTAFMYRNISAAC